MSSCIRLGLFATALCIWATAPAWGATLAVDQGDAGCNDATGAPYCTIQAAIDDANPGDKVNVRRGVYPENVVIDVANLRLRGYSRPVIDGGAATGATSGSGAARRAAMASVVVASSGSR